MPRIPARRALPWIALIVALAAGLRPYLVYLGFGPLRDDAVEWMVYSAVQRPGWQTWVFASQHYSAFRPVAALSYSLNSALGGLDPFGYRLFDLALLGITGLLVARLYRALVPGSRPLGALLALLLFVAHPGLEETLPYLARRSYLLATASSVAALLCFTWALERPARGASALWRMPLRSLPGALLLGCAVLSNEIAFVTVPVIPLLCVLHRGQSRASGTDASPQSEPREAPAPWAPRLLACLLPLALVAAAFAWRSRVMEDLGGYGYATPWRERAVWSFAESWRDLTAWRASVSLLGATPARIGYTLAALYYGWRILSTRPRAGLALLAVWLLGFPLGGVALGVWFPRLTCAALPPLALLAAAVLDTTPGLRAPRAPGARTARLALHLAPQLVFLGLVYSSSPLLFGLDGKRLDEERDQEALMTGLVDGVRGLEEPAGVWLALPYRIDPWSPSPLSPTEPAERAGRQVTHAPKRWAEAWLGERDVKLNPYLFFLEDEDAPRPRLERVGDHLTLELTKGQTHHLGPTGRIERARPMKKGALEIPADRSERRRHVFLFSRGEAELRPVDG